MRTLAVFRKELMEILRNRLLLFSLVPLPLIFVIIPLAIVYFTGDAPVSPQEAEMYARLSPEFAAMDPRLVVQIVIIGQMMFMFLLIPMIVPMTIAAFSIIGEKQSRSLEPLLATPVRTWELLLGKAMAAVLPAIAVTWIAYGIVLVGMRILAHPVVFASVASGMWLLAILIIAPLLALLAVNIGVLISSRVNDTRVAQQIGGILVLPLVGLGVLQTAGVILYNLPMFAAGAAVIAALAALVLAAAVRLFNRETILTRWR
jgi:ABC-2 type transport system permease protein